MLCTLWIYVGKCASSGYIVCKSARVQVVDVCVPVVNICVQVSASRARILIAVECLCRLHQDWLTGKRWSAYIEDPSGEKTNKWKQSEETFESTQTNVGPHTYIHTTQRPPNN